jgi:hypothetical protein
LARAFGWQPRGHRFEPDILHQKERMGYCSFFFFAPDGAFARRPCTPCRPLRRPSAHPMPAPSKAVGAPHAGPFEGRRCTARLVPSPPARAATTSSHTTDPPPALSPAAVAPFPAPSAGCRRRLVPSPPADPPPPAKPTCQVSPLASGLLESRNQTCLSFCFISTRSAIIRPTMIFSAW